MPLVSDRLAGAVKAALVGTALLAAPLAASAQQGTTTMPTQAVPPPAPSAQAPSSTKAKRPPRADRVETRIKSMHDQLKITADQEPQWNAVAQVMRENARAIDQLASERSAKRASMNAVDNLRSYEAIADTHAEELKKLVPAFEALYDKMSDAQKKNADTVFNKRPRARRAATSRG
jgi:molecular chaperone GrpE (heat shock protein)